MKGSSVSVKKARCKIRPYTQNSMLTHARQYSGFLGAGTLATHRNFCLMLLGSPPDMVHSIRLRKTHPSLKVNCKADHTSQNLIKGNHPCCSGLQVQGTADAPAGMALFHILLYKITAKYREDGIWHNILYQNFWIFARGNAYFFIKFTSPKQLFAKTSFQFPDNMV